MTPRPPLLFTWLMRVSVPPQDRDAVLGDLHEEFAACAARRQPTPRADRPARHRDPAAAPTHASAT